MATSVITNTITDLDGTAISGVVVVARLKPGPGFRTADGSEIAAQDSTTTNSSGVWSMTLERNSGIDPTGSYYEVEEQIPEANGGVRVWSISVGASNQTLFAALVSALPTGSGPTYLTQASADARYQALGSLGSTSPTVRASAFATAGVATSALRSDAIGSLHSEIAGNGLGMSGGILAVNVDAVGIEISADTLQLKDAGVTRAKMAAAALSATRHYEWATFR